MQPMHTGVFRGNRVRTTDELKEWHGRAPQEAVIEPELPIVDSHHHLYGSADDSHYYRRDDLVEDLSGGHRVLGTVYVEAFASGWHQGGPLELRSLGEVDMIVDRSAKPVSTPWGSCKLAAAIVSHVDLTAGDAVATVLEAHLRASNGRLRGIRQHATCDSGEVGRFVFNAPAHLLADVKFRKGVAQLRHFGLSFDALVFHTQLTEVAHLADAFPDIPIVLNHIGIPLGVGNYRHRRIEVLSEWERRLRDLGKRSNVMLKLGGMGMPLFGFGWEHADSPPSSEQLADAWKPFIDVSLEAFGARRCMFESNFPVDKQSCGFLQLWNTFKLATHSLSQDERRSLFYGTACMAYRLPQLKAACEETTTRAEDGRS